MTRNGSIAQTAADRRSALPAGLTLLVLLIASALLVSPPGMRLEETIGLPLLFSWRGERQPPDTVAIVAFDEESVAALELPDLDQLERWPRTVHADVIRLLQQQGAAAIALDIAFLSPGDPAADAQLAAAMRAAGNVTILKLLDHAAMNTADKTSAAAISVQSQLEPIAAFENAAAAVNVFTLPDQALKKYTWLFPQTPEGTEASMPLVALQLYYRDARPALLEMLDTRGETNLATELERETRPAFFAARMRAELARQPALTAQLESMLTRSHDQNTAQKIRILLRAYQAPDPAYINFYGPQRKIPTISLHQLLRAPASSGMLRGKAVFVGLSERFSKQRDYFFTAYPSAGDSRVSGVEVAATLFANLMEQRLLQVPAVWQQLLGLWCWGALLFIASRNLRPSHWLLLTLSMTGAYLLLAVLLFSRASLWLPIVVPLLVATPAIALLTVWRFYRRSHAGERAATAALSLYIPAEIAESVAQNRQHLLAQHRQIDAICLLTDIVGFTSLSEKRDAVYMHDLINRYYCDIVADVEQYGGTVANIVGDGLLALWPVDGDAAAQALRATQCALAIVATSDRLTATLGEPLTTCAGLHCGPISLGHLGAGRHFEYAPVGDTINTTSRIQGQTRHFHCRILVSDPLRQCLTQSEPNGLDLQSRGDVALRGKHEFLLLHELKANAF